MEEGKEFLLLLIEAVAFFLLPQRFASVSALQYINTIL